MAANLPMDADDAARRARARRMALLLGLVALVFYGAFFWFKLNSGAQRPQEREWIGPATSRPAASPAASPAPAPAVPPESSP